MNKLILIFIGVISLGINGYCQLTRWHSKQPTETWYFKQFGVTDLNQLSTETLKKALRSEQNKAIPGRIMIPVGLIGFTAGTMVALEGLIEEDKTEARTGGWVVLGGFVTMLVGMDVLSPHPSHIRDIKPVLRSRKKEAKLGLINWPTFDISGNRKNTVTPGLIITLKF